MFPRNVKVITADGSPMEMHRYDATGRDLHIDGPLSEILVNYRPEGFIADRIFPLVTVGKQSDLFYQFQQSDLWRVPDTTRAPMTAAKRVNFNVASQTYYAKNYALATGIPIEDAINADQMLSLRENKGKFLVDILALDYENRVASLVCNTSNVGTFCALAIASGTAGSTGCWDAATASPIVDIDNAIQRVRDASGYLPNNIVFGWLAWQKFRRHANVRAQLFPSAGGTTPSGGVVQPNMVSGLFDIPNVSVAGVMRNTAAEGLAQSLADIWGPHVAVFYTPPRPSREVPSFGYSFRWQAPGLPTALTAEDLGYDKVLHGNLLEVGMYQDEKIVSTLLGTLVGSVSS